MGDQLKQWRDEQKHLPEFMRDFHNCKDLFKTISEYIVCEEDHPANEVNWKQAHCYTIDVSLWFMAEHGYTLQRSRARHEFTELHERIRQMNDHRRATLTALLQQGPSYDNSKQGVKCELRPIFGSNQQHPFHYLLRRGDT